MKCCKHIAQQGTNILLEGNGNPRGDTIVLAPPSGGTKSVWRREAQSRGGNSKRTVQRLTRGIIQSNESQMKSMPESVANSVVTQVYSSLHTEPLFKYTRYKRLLIVTDPEDQLTLQVKGGMTDRQFEVFNCFLAKLTGLSLREKKTPSRKCTMPDFGVYSVEVIIKGKKVKRQSLRIDTLTSALCDRIIALIEAKILLRASMQTKLSDSTIMVRFMGDKGGPFMSTKFGFTVMNCRDPNSPDSFDICATLDAPDSYHNMKVGIFDHYKEELAFYYDLDCPPRLFLLLLEDKVLTAFVFKTDGTEISTVWDKSAKVSCRKETEPSSTGKHVGGPCSISKDTQMQVLEEDGLVWGLQTLNTGRNDGNILQFRTPASIPSLDATTTKEFDLHTVLGGDIDFLNCVVGLQNCTASFPCNKCLMRLTALRGRAKDMHEPPPQTRTKEQQKQFLSNVQREDGPAKQKEAAKNNGSTIRAQLIPVDFSRLLIAVLHIVLGIVFDKL